MLTLCSFTIRSTFLIESDLELCHHHQYDYKLPLSSFPESNGGTGWCDGGECFADVTDGGGGGVYFGGVCVGGVYFGGVHNGGVYFTPTSCIDFFNDLLSTLFAWLG